MVSQPRFFVIIMKRIIILGGLVYLICSWVILSSSATSETIPQQLANQKLSTFKQEVFNFKSVIIANKAHNIDVVTIQKKYFNLRSAYKQVEFLLEFTDPALIKEAINGAPLPHLDKTAPSLIVLNPVGLQVIDELIQELPDSAALSEILVQCNLLYESIHTYQWQTKIYDRYVFEGAFVALIRLFNLGISGFDTPGSLNGISDACSVLKSLHEFLGLYEHAFAQKNQTLFNDLKHLLSSSIAELSKTKNFNDFDRFNFLVNHLNPLISKFNEAKHFLQIETMEEVNPGLNALNFEANSLFDPNLLQKDFYLKIPNRYRDTNAIYLGKFLFYDPILSANNKRSCASCHNPSLAFTDGIPKSRAYEADKFIQRNAPSLINSVYAERFFYDLRAGTLEDQTEHVIFSKEEFNSSYLEIFKKLNGSQRYKQLFEISFPDFKGSSINRTTLSYALAAYVGSLTSFDSPFDQAVRTANKGYIDKHVVKGFNLFMGKAACGTCHFAPVFNGTTPPFYFESEAEVLGVPQNPNDKEWVLDDDKGKSNGRFKENVYFNEYAFKTPTIRNLSSTKPYMHNGSFESITSVLDFYNNGGGLGRGLQIAHQTLASDKLNLSKQELFELSAFLNSLNDTNYRFAQPRELPIIENYPELNNRVIGGVY